jgi:p-hydroxybenzoate 3-monooxygenase
MIRWYLSAQAHHWQVGNMTQALHESTTVAIVGGGVAGLTAAILLRSCGISSILLERQSRARVEERQRAGLVEHRAVRMFEQWGLGHVLHGFPSNNLLEVRVDGQSRLLTEDLPDIGAAGKSVPQQALVRGLIAAFLSDGGDLRFEAADVVLHRLDSGRPVVSYTDSGGQAREIECDFVAGCDGDRGISAASIPPQASTVHRYDYGIRWLTVLADAPAPRYALMAAGQRGYAAQFARGPHASRFYLHVADEDTVDDWPDDRIWAELRHRLHQPGLPTGPVTATEVFPLRSSIREPMSHGRLYLLGDAAHIIPPMGAKGMNLALFDAEVFASAVRDFTVTGDESGLRGYSNTCLARTWRYQEYSNWLADMMHGASGSPVGGGGSFRERIMRARLDRLLSSEAAARYYAEMFTGLG